MDEMDFGVADQSFREDWIGDRSLGLLKKNPIGPTTSDCVDFLFRDFATLSEIGQIGGDDSVLDLSMLSNQSN